MPKYILEVSCEENNAEEGEKYTSLERLTFMRHTDRSAIRYAFDARTIDAPAEDKKLFRIMDPQGSTMRIYPEDDN